MKQTEKTFQILDALHREEISTQRQLADYSGISLGQVNYILKSLLKKGFVKIGNFKKNPHKIGYMYILTPKGIEAKSKLAVKFVMRKLKEYEVLRNHLSERLTAIQKKGHSRILFVGPARVKEFIHSIVREQDLELTLVDHYTEWQEIRDEESESFDIALLFDDTPDVTKNMEEILNIPKRKILPLW